VSTPGARVARTAINPAVDRALVPSPSADAAEFHAALDGYEPTPFRELPALAEEFGIAAVALKDESTRLGLPAFKVLGASWAVERALREHPETHTLVAASAGNHGRAVAHVAAQRDLAARIYLPERASPARREAISGEGADVVVVDGTYEDAVARARADGAHPGAFELADVGDSEAAVWVIDGYATLFSELIAQGTFDLLLVPVGVGALAAAAARFGAHHGVHVIGVEPTAAACLTASISAGAPMAVATPGTAMASLDAGEVSIVAWPSLHHGIAGTITVSDEEASAAVDELEQLGLEIGPAGAAPLAALRALGTDPECAPLRSRVAFGSRSRVVLLATEGRTDRS
jgi:diaminopropionate ammonia-lyase